jgi:hypothetical protein
MYVARRRVLAACLSGLAGVSLLAGCGGAPTGAPSGPASATHTTPIQNAVDPAHAVADPGKWDGKLRGPDLLVVGETSLSRGLVKKIKAIRIGKGKHKVRGVAVDVPLSLGQFAMENHTYNVAAVNPSTYRDFTGQTSAAWQEQWNRVAGGEIVVAKKLDGTIPIDKSGYVAIGSGGDTQKIHVGAWSPSTVYAVDAIVNQKWGQSLGLPQNNGLLINTGLASPDQVRKKIEAINGDLSVTAMDAVARYGIDPKAVQNVQFVGSYSEAVGLYRYTPIGGGRIAPDPVWVAAHLETKVMPIIGPMTCNRVMFPQLYAALREIQARGLAAKITNYAGCYNPRFIAGSTTLSNHAFGLAFDIDPADNARGTVGHMDPGVVQTFERWGFTWGGTWNYTDPMHFELNRIVQPG